MFYFNVFFNHISITSNLIPTNPPIRGGSTPSRRARRPDTDGTGTFSTLRRRVEKLRRWSGDLSEVTFQVGEKRVSLTVFRCSMGLAYLPTKLGSFGGKCR